MGELGRTYDVDGRNPANQLRLVVHPIICRVLCIPAGAGLLSSTVLPFAFLSYVKVGELISITSSCRTCCDVAGVFWSIDLQVSG